jgi:small conductance mechanosensitive channel
MENWEIFGEVLLSYLPLMAVFFVLGAVLWGTHWFLIGRYPNMGNERKLPRQLILLGLVIISLLILVLALPIDDSSRNQLIGLVGLVLSGLFAFSSTNVLANLMAGILLRITKPFRIGDFIRVNEYFGRVTERGLFDTEIQTESRELIAVPNSFLIITPVTTIRSSGVIISATLSLAYDVPHLVIEPLLIKAARETGLEEPYVHILELGNFSVTYRVSGLLTDIKYHITARSDLNSNILDALHEGKVEIVSPYFLNQRVYDTEKRFIPRKVSVKAEKETITAEDLAFDKAESAERLDKEKYALVEEIEQLEEALKEARRAERENLRNRLEKDLQLLRELEQKTDSD